MPSGQEFVRATVHLVGAVEIETGHAANYSGAAHVQARIGSALVYLLDYIAAHDFVRAVAVAQQAASGGAIFDTAAAPSLPPDLPHGGQDTSLIVRLQGTQTGPRPQAVAANASRHGRPFLTCQLGGLVLVLHDAAALDRLAQVADTAHRVAAALWPVAAQLVHDDGPAAARKHSSQTRT